MPPFAVETIARIRSETARRVGSTWMMQKKFVAHFEMLDSGEPRQRDDEIEFAANRAAFLHRQSRGVHLRAGQLGEPELPQRFSVAAELLCVRAREMRNERRRIGVEPG